MIQEQQLVSIFCEIDDFCKELNKNMSQLQLTGPFKGGRGPTCCLSISEIMTVQFLKDRCETLAFVVQYGVKLVRNEWSGIINDVL